MSRKNYFAIAGLSGLLMFILIILLKVVDVKPIGPDGSMVGLATINLAVFQAIHPIHTWYVISNVLGYAAIVVVGVIATAVLYQAVKRHGVLKADRELLYTMILYWLTASCYGIFEILTINHRPAIFSGSRNLEPSFPSSHTMLAVVVFGSTMIIVNRYIENKRMVKIVQIVLLIAILLTSVGRLLGGVHWFTDIAGGVLMGISLVGMYVGVIKTNN